MYLIINKWETAVKVSNFFGHCLRNHWTLDIGVLGYIGIVWPKEHSPEVWSVPPVTLCIYIYIYIYVGVYVFRHLRVKRHDLIFYDHKEGLRKIDGRIEVKGRRGRRSNQLLDDYKETRRYCKSKEAALDGTVLKTRFGRGYEPNVRQNKQRMSKWIK